jgi:hypothetical protein
MSDDAWLLLGVVLGALICAPIGAYFGTKAGMR